jgi:hypothetical protein
MAQHLILPGSLTAAYTDTQYTTKALLPRVGDTYYDQANAKAYIFLKNTGSSAIPAKTVATALTTAKSSFTCELPAATNDLPFAGARVSGATSLAQNEYGWFQVKGSATLLADAAGTTAEKHCVTSNATAGRVETQSSTYAVAMGPATVFGIAETTTTTGDVVVSLVGNVWGI